jgi:uncharacterized membrane protein
MVEEQNGGNQPGSDQPEQSQQVPQPAAPSYTQDTNDQNQSGKTSSGLDANLAGLLCYLFGWVSGLIFFLIEKDNKFVRFHAMQSILLNVALIALYVVSGILTAILFFVPVLGKMLIGLIGIIMAIAPLAFLGLAILLMVKAYQGEKFKLPIIGDMAEKNA